jgi:hypothetical protein
VQRSDLKYADAVQRDGWQHQANHLTVIHTIVGRAAMIVAEQVRRLLSLKRATYHNRTPSAEFERGLETGKNELVNELEQTRAKLAERDSALICANQWIEYLAERGAKLEQQVTRDSTALQILTEHEEVLAAQAVAANKRVAELEGELGSAREGLVLRENENRSLEASLNLIVSESSRLSRRLTESEAAVDDAKEKRQTGTNTLDTRLEAMASRALAAERLLEEVRQRLLPRTDARRAVERKVVDEIAARDTVDNKLELFQNSLLVKLSAARGAQPNAEVDLVKLQKKIEALDFERQCMLKKRTVAEGAREKTGTNCDELCELDNDVRYDGKYSERAEVRSTEMLLASILTS